jgi:hypothetical protein
MCKVLNLILSTERKEKRCKKKIQQQYKSDIIFRAGTAASQGAKPMAGSVSVKIEI